jgi:hypothetical protein
MIVNVDVYTKDLDAALAAVKLAIESGATSVRLNSNEDYDTKKFENVNLMFEADHTSVAISKLDGGPFVKDSSDL